MPHAVTARLTQKQIARILADKRANWMIALDYNVCGESIARLKRKNGKGRIVQGEVKLVNGKRVATPEYRTWQNMKQRVDYPERQGYQRTLPMDPRWEKFEAFLADMGRKPHPHLTLDRIDNDLGYSKNNCRWATRREQARNRSYYHKCDMKRAEKIRKMYATGNYYQYELGEIFGLTQAHVSQITRNVCWTRE